MRLALVLLGAVVAGGALRPQNFRFERGISVASGAAESACAVLDGVTYEHAGASLDDVRLFSGSLEVPYALTMSNVSYSSAAGEQAKVLNLGSRGGRIVFDLAMPARAYTAVNLNLTGKDFVGTAKVTGSSQAGGVGVNLGTFTLFDLSRQKLGRNTVLGLQESSFPFLHVDVAVKAASGASQAATPVTLEGAMVPPSREAETIYTQVAKASSIVRAGTKTEARFDLPARVPVERVRFELARGDRTNFSRTVRVTAHPVGAPEEEREEIVSEIDRISKSEEGQALRHETLSVPATLGANAREPATVVVSVENGDDRPLAITGVELEMRQRKLCFDVPAGGVTMVYGDAGLAAPRYDFSRVFQPSGQTRVAALGAERLNPDYVAPVDRRSFSERHPGLIWLALLGAVAALGGVALRSGRQVGRRI